MDRLGVILSRDQMKARAWNVLRVRGSTETGERDECKKGIA